MICIILGALRSNPIPKLLEEANKRPLPHRRSLQSYKYWLKICAKPQHPNHRFTIERTYLHQYNSSPRKPKPLNIHCYQDSQTYHFTFPQDVVSSLELSPLWIHPSPLTCNNCNIKWTTHLLQHLIHTSQPLSVHPLTAYRTNCREEIILARFRIGHTLLTHSHLNRGNNPPQCESGADGRIIS